MQGKIWESGNCFCLSYCLLLVLKWKKLKRSPYSSPIVPSRFKTIMFSVGGRSVDMKIQTWDWYCRCNRKVICFCSWSYVCLKFIGFADQVTSLAIYLFYGKSRIRLEKKIILQPQNVLCCFWNIHWFWCLGCFCAMHEIFKMMFHNVFQHEVHWLWDYSVTTIVKYRTLVFAS